MMSVCTREIEGIWFGVACDEEQVFATNFASSEKNVLQGLLESIPVETSFQQFEMAPVFADHVLTALKRVYDGKDVSIDFTLATEHLSDYTRRVIRVAQLIPAGYVASYGSVARVAGGSPRGVGRVMALNPFAPIVPCHRVVGSDLKLVGYGGGLDAKLNFLKRERRGLTSELEIPVDGKKLTVFPVELVLERARSST